MGSIDHLTTADLVKVLVPAAIALFIAATGWIVTNRYNNTQLAIARRKNDADLEIARVNASLEYLKVVTSIPQDGIDQRRQALAVATPVLPVEMAFDLAVRGLADDAGPLNFLIRKHGEESWANLVHFIELPIQDSDIGAARLCLPDCAPAAIQQPADQMRGCLAVSLLTHLEKERYLEQFYGFLMAANYQRTQLRANALLYYYRFRNSRGDHPTPDPSENQSNRVLVERALGEQNLPVDARAAVALAGCAAFATGDGDLSEKELMIAAAEYFWVGFDVSVGELPRENDIQSLVYRHRFVYKYGDIRVDYPDALHRVSVTLLGRLLALDFAALSIDRVTTILYSYAESTPRGSVTPFGSYLVPSDARSLMFAVLKAANTPSRRRELAMHLGSLSGETLFSNISQSTTEGRMFIEQDLLPWYTRWYQHDWYLPKFFSDAAEKYPELRGALAGKPWTQH